MITNDTAQGQSPCTYANAEFSSAEGPRAAIGRCLQIALQSVLSIPSFVGW